MKPVSLVSFLVVLAACSSGETAAPQPPSAAVAALLLANAPAGTATPVLAIKQAPPAGKVAVTGRINSIVKGAAAFTLMDPALPYCGEKSPEDGCKTPWDYCCESKETRVQNTLAVEARGADGKPLPTPSLGDLRLLDRVIVTGNIEKDVHGNLVLLANGWFREQRPTLADGLRWPQ